MTRFSVSARSRRFVDEERDVTQIFEREVHKALTFVDCVTAETLSKEDMPVRLPFVIHVLLDQLRNLHALLFKVVLLESLS